MALKHPCPPSRSFVVSIMLSRRRSRTTHAIVTTPLPPYIFSKNHKPSYKKAKESALFTYILQIYSRYHFYSLEHIYPPPFPMPKSRCIYFDSKNTGWRSMSPLLGEMRSSPQWIRRRSPWRWSLALETSNPQFPRSPFPRDYPKIELSASDLRRIAFFGGGERD